MADDPRVPAFAGNIIATIDAGASLRNDLQTMLLPFFPEEGGHESYEVEIDGRIIQISSNQPGETIATASDRKVLNALAARISEMVRAGLRPTRHLLIDVRTIIDTLTNDGIAGGSEYQRIHERLSRLRATQVNASSAIDNTTTLERSFGWVDAFEKVVKETPGGRKVVAIKISLSEDAFGWITQNQGFDIPREEFHAITSSRASSWRIYEICLARLMQSHGGPTWIAIDELRRRVPISSDLKVFKYRTLKVAMQTIAETPQMARTLSISLERETEGGFRPLKEKERAPLSQLHVCVRKGVAPLPLISRLIPECDPMVAAVEPALAGTGEPDLFQYARGATM